MTGPITGLQTSIWNNNLRSLIMLAAYPFIIAGVCWLSLAAFGYFSFGHSVQAAPFAASLGYGWIIVRDYWPTIIGVVGLWFLIAYVFQGMIIRSLSRSHPVTRKAEPELYNLLENLCIAQGITMPRLEIIETHARNAFASGVDDKSYCVTVTRGLMQSLSKDELEGVLAHELAHIINRDVRLLMVCVIFTGMLAIAAQLIWSNIRYGLYIPSGNNKNRGNGFLLLLVIGVIVGIGYFASLLARFFISRRREYMADAGAVQMTRNPDAMMRALLRISGMADVPKMPDDVRAMCFENRHAFLGMFATHPPIESRIRAISDYSGLPVPSVLPKRRADAPDVFARPAEPGHRDNWITRQRFADRRNKNPWV